MQQVQDIRHFRGTRVNTDSALELMQPNEVKDVRNMIEDKRSGCMVNMRGFDSVMDLAINSDITVPSVMKCVRAVHDVKRKAVVYLLMDTVGTQHSILRYFTETKKLEWVLTSPYLNFHDVYTSANIIGDLLYFSNGYETIPFVDFNPPCKINMVKACGYTNAWSTTKTYYKGMVVRWLDDTSTYPYTYRCYRYVNDTPLSGKQLDDPLYWELANNGVYAVITNQLIQRVKYPPEYQPEVYYGDDKGIKHNNLKGKLFQFAYRYVYDDNEKSVFSAISELPLPRVPGLLTGGYDDNVISDNLIVVECDSSVKEVVGIEIAARELNAGVWRIVDIMYKFDETGKRLFEDNTTYYFKFYNNEVGVAINQVDVYRRYDAVPQVVKHHDIIEKNRMLDANYVEGFDNVDLDVFMEWGIQTLANSGVGQQFQEFDLLLQSKNQAITWYYGSQYNGGQAYFNFDCAVFDFDGIYEPGYDYLIYFNAYHPGTDNPRYYTYDTNAYEDQYLPPYPVENKGDKLIAFASVSAYTNQDVESFMNDVISQLRQGNSGDESVIAFCYDGNTTGNNHIWGDYVSQGIINTHRLTTKYQLGFVVRDALNTPSEFTQQPAPTEDLIQVNVVKYRKADKFTTFSSGFHQFGIIYKDDAKRAGAVNASKKTMAYVPAQNEYGYTHELFLNFMKWEIKHKPPMGAKYFQFAYAKNVSKYYALQAIITSISEGGALDGGGNTLKFTINDAITETKEVYPKCNIQNYVWEKGDRIKFLFNRRITGGAVLFDSITTSLDFEIIGVLPPSASDDYEKDRSDDEDFIVDSNGNKVPAVGQYKFVIDSFDYGSYGISSENTIVEVYKPSKKQDFLTFYEYGPELPILNPNTDDRCHSGGKGLDKISVLWQRDQTNDRSAKGVFTRGDAYAFYRILPTVFPCESLWYSDYYDSEAIGIGKPCAEDRNMRRLWYPNKLLYSGVYINNTKVNELSTVNSSDSVELPEKFGAINFVKELGYTLKILQENKPQSLYIGRAGITQPSADSTDILTSTKDVLGTLITPENNYGTIHPGGVCSFGKRLWYFDYLSRDIIRDAGNGQQSLTTSYNFRTILNEKLDLLGSADNIDVVSAYDQKNELVYFTFIDKTTASNSFTMAFKDTDGGQEDGYAGIFDFVPDQYGMAENVLTSFKNNGLWVHNSETADRSTFYGTFYKYWVTVVTNKLPLTIKRLLSIFVSSNEKFSCPDAGDVYVPPTGNNPDGMKSLLKAGAFTPVQGKWVADFGKNMISNQSTPTLQDLVDGEDLAGQAASVRLEGSKTTEHKLLAVEINSVTSQV